MEPDFWRERWAQGQTGWHESAPNASLVAHAEMLELGPEKRVLVPLSGKTTDLSFLEKSGAEVIGSELVEVAAQQFFDEHGLVAVRSTPKEGLVSLRAGRIEILVGDFFALTASDVGPIDAIYDRAALVALPPDLRVRYAAQLGALSPHARMLTVTFVHDAPGGGPPFSVDRDELARLYPTAEIEALGERDLFHQGGGLAARGATRILELSHAVRRSIERAPPGR